MNHAHHFPAINDADASGLLRQSRAFKHVAIGMALLDMQGRWIDVNPKFCEMVGFARDDLLSRSYESLTVEDDLPVSRRRVDQLVSGQIETCDFEKRYRCSNGEVIWVHVHASRVPATRDCDSFLITQARDITSERQTRQALADSEASLSLALDGADLGMWHWLVRDGSFTFNDRALKLLGYQEGEIESRLDAIMALSHPDDRQALAEAMNRHLQGEPAVFDRIIRLQRRSGDYMWLLARGRVVQRDLMDRPLKVSGTIMDVTKWKELETRLTELATTDELTGLLNRRSGVAVLESTLDNARTEGNDASMVLLDLDHFKAINDQLGHDVGDQVLEAFGAFLIQHKRQADSAIRWGGEEFAIILPATGAVGAMTQARHLFAHIGSVAEAIDELEQLTASMGVVTLRCGESARDMMKRADALMYQAKRSGRNRIVSDQIE